MARKSKGGSACAVLRANIGKAKSKRERGKALAKYVACKKGRRKR